MNLTFYRPTPPSVGIYSIAVNDNSYVNRNVMGECTAFIEFLRSTPITILPGDYAVIFGETYFVKDTPLPLRDIGRLKYQLTLYGTVNELEKAIYFINDSSGVDNTASTSWSCTPLEFLTQLVVNMNRINPGQWTAGSCIEASAKTLILNNNNCLEALQAATTLWDTHYRVDNFTISLDKIDSETVIPLGVGKDQGLREITANKNNNSEVITKLFPYGSDQNSPTGQKLQIAAITYPGATVLIEGVKEFEDIYPQIVLEITSMVAISLPPDNIYPWELGTAALGFDLNDYLIPGITPRISFLTGELAGLTFNFIRPPMEVFILQITTLGGVVIPGPTGYNPAIGDTFELIGLEMPEVWIEEAQERLLEAAEAYLQEVQPKLKLNVKTDDLYFKRNDVDIPLNVKLNLVSDIIPELADPGRETEVLGYKRYIKQPWRYDNIVVGDVANVNPFDGRVGKIVESQIFKTTIINEGGADSHYEHTQLEASAEWTVRHNLGKKPSVAVTGATGETRDAKVMYLTPNTLKVIFSRPATGSAICN